MMLSVKIKNEIYFFHHEQSASMAADAYYRLNNKPCLLHTTSGPGATNAITGITGAWIANSGICSIWSSS